MVNYLFINFFDMNFATEIVFTKKWEIKRNTKVNKDMNKKNNLNDLKQFIHKNKKENMVLKKILEKMNQSSKKDKQSD